MTTVAPQRHATTRPPAARLGVLGQIAAQRRADVLVELGDASFRAMRRDARISPPARPFAERLAAPGLHLIAEVKRVSPSAGRLAPAGRRRRGPGPCLRGRRGDGHLGPL